MWLLQLLCLCENKVHANAFFIYNLDIIQALVDIRQSENHRNVIRLDEITDDELQEILLTIVANRGELDSRAADRAITRTMRMQASP